MRQFLSPLLWHLTLTILGSSWLSVTSVRAQQGFAPFANASEEANVAVDGLHHAVAVADFNGDGWEDIYVATKQAANHLFLNTGGMHFEEVAEEAGVDDPGNTNATLWADFNNDGWPDLVTGNYLDANRLFLNNGDGTFEDATDAFNFGNEGPCRSLHAAWARGRVHAGHHGSRRDGLHTQSTRVPAVPGRRRLRGAGQRERGAPAGTEAARRAAASGSVARGSLAR